MENEGNGANTPEENVSSPQESNKSMKPEPENGSSYFTIGIVVVVLVIAGGFYLMQNQSDTQEEVEIDTTKFSSVVDTGTMVEISYTEEGFTPKEVFIKAGDTVKFLSLNESPMWVASAIHPTHKVYSGTTLSQHCSDAEDVSFDQCKGGSEYSFTFDKVGVWGYHNHMKFSNTGKIVVE